MSLSVSGISHLVLEVSDLQRGEEFYREILGFEILGRDRWPDAGRNSLLATAGDQHVILSESAAPATLRESGVHQAYRAARASRDAIAKKLAAHGTEIFHYKEDRPAEAEDNFYCHDPDGNRLQLVISNEDSGAAATVQAIDHAAVEVVDIEWAENFYVNILSLTVDHRVGWRTEDYVRAKLWGEGKEEMAPGTRRWDKRYTVMEQKRRLPRPNTHFFVRAGDSVIGIYLATQHRQEPPEEQAVGTPRVALRTDTGALETAAEWLTRAGAPFQGPLSHPSSAPIAASLYFKDSGGNFLELAVPRR